MAARDLNQQEWVKTKLKRAIQPVYFEMDCDTDDAEPLEMALRALGLIGRLDFRVFARSNNDMVPSLGDREKPVKVIIGPASGAGVVSLIARKVSLVP